MKNIVYEFECRSRKDTFQIIPIGDVHCGSSGFSVGRRKLIELVKWIMDDPRRYWLGMGDMVEAINPSDKRHDEAQIDRKYHSVYSDLANEQRKEIQSILEPAKNRCLGLLRGNHEETLRLKYYNDIHSALCVDLESPDLGLSAFINLSFYRLKAEYRHLTLFVAHGKGGGELPGASVNLLMRQLNKFEADVYFLGHVHRKWAGDCDIIQPMSQKLSSKRLFWSKEKPLKMQLLDIRYTKKLFALTGSWVSGYPEHKIDRLITTYVEKGLLPPASLGCPILNITPFTYSMEDRASRLNFHISV